MKWDWLGLLSLFSENLRLLWRGWRGCRWHETLANHGASGGRGKHLPSSYSLALGFSTGYATFASVLTDYILLELPIENALYPFSPWLTNHFDHCGLDLRHFVTCSCCCFCRLQMNQEFFCIQICVSFLFENLILKWAKREAYVFWRSLLVLVFTYRQSNQFSQKKNWSDGQKTLSVTNGIRLACVLIISIPPSICWSTFVLYVDLRTDYIDKTNRENHSRYEFSTYSALAFLVGVLGVQICQSLSLRIQILFYGILYLKTPRAGTADRLPCRQLVSKIKIDLPTFPCNC